MPDRNPPTERQLAASEIATGVFSSLASHEPATQAIARPVDPEELQETRFAPPQFPPPSPPRTPTGLPHVPGYEIMGILGRGGMGVVYKARHLGLNRIVALKMVLANNHAPPEEMVRFRQEAEAVAALKHPNIVQIYDTGAHEGLPYFSLEYVDGGTLANLISGKPQPPKFAAEIIEILARAIHTAHLSNFIHRDLKPANVLLSRFALDDRTAITGASAVRQAEYSGADSQPRDPISVVPKITDFGLAKRLDVGVDLTATGMLAGTPQYMAPEQISGRRDQLGPLVDQHALGIMLYEMLTGVSPFIADGPMEAMNRVVKDVPVSPARLRPKVPRDLDTICMKSLEKEPSKRYPTALAFAEDLRRFIDGAPIQARPISGPERVWRWAKRNPKVAIPIAAFLVSLIGGLAASSYFAIQANEEAKLARKAEGVAVAEGDKARKAEGVAVQEKKAAEAAKDEEMAAKEQAQKAEQAEKAAKEQEERAKQQRERELYDARMNLAQQAWDEGNVVRLTELLRRQIPAGPTDPDPRRFEWYYLDSVRFSALAEVSRLATPGGVVAATADGALTAWAGADDIHLFDTNTGEPKKFKLSGHGGKVAAATFSPDGKRLLTAGRNGAVHLWNPATGERISSVKTLGLPHCLRFAPSGETLAIGCEATKPDAEDAACVLYDGKLTGKGLPLLVGGKFVASVAFTPDGKRVITAEPEVGLTEWDAVSGKSLRAVKMVPPPLTLAVSPTKKLMAVGAKGALSGGRVTIVDTDTLQPVRVMKGVFGPVHAAAFAADGVTLAAGDWAGAIRVWNTDTGELLNLLRGHGSAVIGATFVGPKSILASTSVDGRNLLWEALEAQDFRTFTTGEADVVNVFPRPDGRSAVVVGWTGEAGAFDLTSGQGKWTRPKANGTVAASALTADGTTLITLGREGALESTAVADGSSRTMELKGLAAAPTGMATSADGKRIATIHEGGTVHVHTVGGTAGPVKLANTTSPVHGLVVRPDGSEVAAFCGNGVRIWDAATGQVKHLAEMKTSSAVRLAYSNDGSQLAVMGTDDGLVQVFDSATLKPKPGLERGLEGHSERVLTAAFSPEGDRLATAGADRAVKLWDLTTGLEVLSFSCKDELPTRVRFLPDGTGLLVVAGGKARFYDARNGTTRELFRTARRLFRAVEPKAAPVAAGSDIALTFALRNAGKSDFKLPPTASRTLTPDVPLRVIVTRPGGPMTDKPVYTHDLFVEIAADVPRNGSKPVSHAIPTKGWAAGRYRVQVVQPLGRDGEERIDGPVVEVELR